MNTKDLEYEYFLYHIDDTYFFCPLCENYHKKMYNRKTGKWHGHSMCQMPVEFNDDKY